MRTPDRTARRTPWTALTLGLALTGALAGVPALAQDASNDGAAGGAAIDASPAAPRVGTFWLRHGPDGAIAMRAMRFAVRAGSGGPFAERLDGFAGRRAARSGGSGGAHRGDAFARWLDADADAGPLIPGLVGRLADGATVRLTFYAGAPEDGGTERAALTFVAGEDDAASFRREVRAAAEDATHVVVDVLGRVVALPTADPADVDE